MPLASIMRVAIVCWSAAMLTAFYSGLMPKTDVTFLAGLLSSALGSFGIDVIKRDPDAQPPTPPRKPPTTS